MICVPNTKINSDLERWFADDVSKNLGICLGLQATLTGDLGFVININELLANAGAGITNGMNDAAPVRVFAIP